VIGSANDCLFYALWVIDNWIYFLFSLMGRLITRLSRSIAHGRAQAIKCIHLGGFFSRSTFSLAATSIANNPSSLSLASSLKKSERPNIPTDIHGLAIGRLRKRLTVSQVLQVEDP
jgi:hypothetical protein